MFLSAIGSTVDLDRGKNSSKITERTVNLANMSPLRLTISLMVIVLSLVHKLIPAFALSNESNLEDPDNNWRWKYYLELVGDSFEPLLVEKSVDQRLANLLYTHKTHSVFELEMHTLNTDDPLILEEYRQFVKGREVDQAQCSRDLQQMLNLMAEMGSIVDGMRSTTQVPEDTSRLDQRHIRLARVLDSYGRPSGGLLDGNYEEFGSPDECLDSRLQLDHNQPNKLTGTRLCRADLSLEHHLDPRLQATGERTYRASLETAICLPNTCHTTSFERNRELIQLILDSQFTLPGIMFVDKHPKIRSIFCVNEGNESIRYPPSGLLLMAFMCTWIATTMYVTFFRKAPDPEAHDWLSALNIKDSINRFTESDSSFRSKPLVRRVNLDAMAGVKVLFTSAVVLGHTFLALYFNTADTSRMRMKSESSSSVYLIQVAILFIVSFATISGMLITQIALKRLRFQQPKDLTYLLSTFSPLIVLRRFMRLTPLYFLAFWFKKSILLYISFGLLHDPGFNKNTIYGSCRQESWLTPFTGQAAYLPLSRQCLGQLWTISSDLFFAAIGAPIITLLHHKPKFGIGLAIILSILGISTSISDLLHIEPRDGFLRNEMSQYISTYVSLKYNFYSASHNRMSQFLIGVIFGYILHLYEEGKINKWSRWFTEYATKLATVSIVVVLVSAIFPHSLLKHDPLNFYVAFLMTIFTHSLWPFTSAVLFTRMMTDWSGSYLVKISSGKFFHVLSKLGMAILVVHMDIIVLQIFAHRSKPTTRSFAVWTLFGSTYFYSVILGLILHILFELPITILINQMMRRIEEKFNRSSSDKVTRVKKNN